MGKMNVITILTWITIAIIGVIGIIVVKLHYANKELETEEPQMISDSENTMQNAISGIKEKITSSSDELSKDEKTPSSDFFNKPQNDGPVSLRKEGTRPEEYAEVIVPEIGSNTAGTIEYESPTQVTINYEKEVKKFQEPIKQSQMDIMTQNKFNDKKDDSKHELKDLFTIDELIKESKRKDSEREKESKRISKDDDSDLDEIKESIKMRKENKQEDALIEEVVEEETKEESIADAIKSSETEEPKIDTSASQKDIDEAIESATNESEEEIEDISEKESITDVLIENEEEIKAPTLKSPTKINEDKEGVSILSGDDADYKFGGELEDSELFNDDMNDLDYRKDLAKVTNKLKNSKLLQDVRDRLAQEPEEIDTGLDESFIRNVHEYDEYEPIINETYIDTDDDYDSIHAFDDVDPQLRQANTLKVLKNEASSEVNEPKVAPIKNKPSRENIKINLNNNEVVLKKGDEIIFKYDGETYSSQVYSINGDDISVRYRRKNITIKPEDVKKIY